MKRTATQSYYFDLRPPGQDRGAKTRPLRQLKCANPGGRPGGWSGLELTDTLYLNKINTKNANISKYLLTICLDPKYFKMHQIMP